MNRFTRLFVILFTASITTIAQTYNISGTVSNSKTGLKLSFANIRIDKSTRGTAANIDGKYKLNLEEGNFSLIASYIGYKSDTVNLTITGNQIIDFKLHPIELEIAEVTVEPGRNPAYDIIRSAIKTKNLIEKKINSYKYSAYTKGLVKTTRDFSGGGFSLSTQDTGKLKITGILENESRGFYKKPDNNKHYIVARKQSANTPPFINILTGGNVIQSFYEDDLTFMGKKIPSPISEEALSYYYFYIEKEIAIDDKKVFQIFFNTDNTAAPGFYGKLFIMDSTFQLLKVDAALNQMANPGGLFTFVKVYQQFSVFQDDIALPIDYRLFAEGNYLGLAKFGFELHTIMSSYEINTEIDDDLFDSAIISVLPEADKKDDNYWSSIQSIPNTFEEEIAYSRIDSLAKVSQSFGQDFSILASRLKLNKNFSIVGPIALYSFNKVEGNTLNLELFYNDAEAQRLNINATISYGFADDIVKKKIYGTYKFGQYRTTKLSLNIYDKLTDLFGVSDNYNKFTSTFLSLISKYDFRDYYYTKGFDAKISSEVLPILQLGIGYISRIDKTAKNNSDYSFFNNDKEYSTNKVILDTETNALKTTFKLDFRKFIEDGFFRRRITPRSNIQFEGSALFSQRNLLNSDLDFTIYNFKAYGSLITAGNWSLDYYVNKTLSNGNVPFQWLYALPGNINAAGKNNSFRTLGIGEVYGDDVTTLFLRHNFNDDLFKLSQIPFLSDLQLQLSTHLNIALSDISEDSRLSPITDYKKFNKPFYELGFSIGHVLIPLSFEFTWKLNYRGNNNFVFGINTFAF